MFALLSGSVVRFKRVGVSEVSISYADRGGAKGYQVRVTRNGKQYAKFFNVKEKGARKKAKEYERQLLELLGPPRSQVGDERPVRTNTGIRHISEATGKYGTKCFRVSFRQKDGKWTSRDVSIDFHGRDKAMRIAKKIHRDRHVPLKKSKFPKTPSPKIVRRTLDA